MALSLFTAVVQRLKAVLAAAAAQDLEADYLARDAERKAELLRQAAEYEREGMADVATDLRRQAERLCTECPATVLPAVEALAGTTPATPAQLPAAPDNTTTTEAAEGEQPAATGRRRKSS